MKTSKGKILASTAAILIATSFAACSKSEAQQNAKPSVQAQAVLAASEMATTSFAIEHMTCATCPISVRKAMKRVDGVKSVKVDFKTKLATVVYDPAKTTPAQIAAASTNVGYPASEVVG